jgi:hypothetical protein
MLRHELQELQKAGFVTHVVPKEGEGEELQDT